MLKRIIIITMLVLLPLIQGCALIGAAVSAAAAYGISQALD